jgi:hypothetical protein
MVMVNIQQDKPQPEKASSEKTQFARGERYRIWLKCSHDMSVAMAVAGATGSWRCPKCQCAWSRAKGWHDLPSPDEGRGEGPAAAATAAAVAATPSSTPK